MTDTMKVYRFTYIRDELTDVEVYHTLAMLIMYNQRDMDSLITHITNAMNNWEDRTCIAIPIMRRSLILLNIIKNSIDKEYVKELCLAYANKEDPSLDYILKFMSGILNIDKLLEVVEEQKDTLTDDLYLHNMNKLKTIYEMRNRYWVIPTQDDDTQGS